MSNQKSHLLQAVVLTDTFKDEFYPITKDIPSSLIPFMGEPVLWHTLKALSEGGVREVILFCKSGASAIREFIRKCDQRLAWPVLKIRIIKSDNCLSLGDCFRDLDKRGLIRGNFVFVEPGAITNINLLPIFKKHKRIMRKDKDACLTMICMDVSVEQSLGCGADHCSYITTPDKKLLFYQTFNDSGPKRDIIPMELINKYDELEINFPLRDIGIYICSEKFLSLFSDNFDFQTKDEFIKNLLMNEEISDCSMYIHPLEYMEFGGSIINWQNYLTVSFEVLDVIESISNRYKNINAHLPRQKSIVASNTIIPKSAKMTRCVLGENVKIGECVCLEDSIIFSNSVIGDNVIIRLSVVGSNCIIEKNCEVINNSVLGDNVKLSESTKVDKLLVQATKPEHCDQKDILGEQAYIANVERDALPRMKTLKDLEDKLREDSEYIETDSEDDESSDAQPEVDDTELFLEEVVESMKRGLEETVKCENLIVEINGSRYAYHIPLEEVNFFVIKGILKIASEQPELKYLQTILTKFKRVLQNYVCKKESMRDCLAAIEDQAVSKGEEDKDWVLFILKWCYNNDILSEEVILEWGKALHPEEKLYIKIHPFLTWLDEAEEESSEEESSEEESSDEE